ncbi:MAG: tautomerase family protein [Chloroflexota bacterium]|jgi:4-oxalocrotonate tautomerase
MPVIRVSMWTGRTKEQKVALAKAITDSFAEIAQTKPEAVTIIFEEVDKSNWAHAGTLVSDQ